MKQSRCWYRRTVSSNLIIQRQRTILNKANKFLHNQHNLFFRMHNLKDQLISKTLIAKLNSDRMRPLGRYSFKSNSMMVWWTHLVILRLRQQVCYHRLITQSQIQQRFLELLKTLNSMICQYRHTSKIWLQIRQRHNKLIN